jgi:hypothetical protein
MIRALFASAFLLGVTWSARADEPTVTYRDALDTRQPQAEISGLQYCEPPRIYLRKEKR